LQGIAIEDIENLQILDEKDPDYQVTIGVRAIKE
jgi:hypothetical protein